MRKWARIANLLLYDLSNTKIRDQGLITGEKMGLGVGGINMIFLWVGGDLFSSCPGTDMVCHIGMAPSCLIPFLWYSIDFPDPLNLVHVFLLSPWDWNCYQLMVTGNVEDMLLPLPLAESQGMTPCLTDIGCQ